jgi:ribulose-phosphate 3-epimerase
MATIVPAILAKDISTFEEELKKVEAFAPKVQMDVLDGKFMEVETVIPDVLLSIETGTEIEAHLMVEEPREWVERCVAAGVTVIYGQVEKMSDKQAFITAVEEAGLRVGLAYDLKTSLNGLEEWVNLVDYVLLMGVPAGEQGQIFDEKVLEKIRKVREMSEMVTIVVDGGLDEENIRRCLEEGGEKMEFAVGSKILLAEEPETVFRKLEAVN